MQEVGATQIVRSIDTLSVGSVETDADTVIIHVTDTDRGPRNFNPNTLAQILQHDRVFDAWVDGDEFYVQIS